MSLLQRPGPSADACRLAAALWPPDSSSGCASQRALQLAMAEPERPALVAIGSKQCLTPSQTGSRPESGLWQPPRHPSSAHAAQTSGRPAAGRVLQMSVPGSHDSCQKRLRSLRSGSQRLHPAVVPGGLPPPYGAAAPTFSWQAAVAARFEMTRGCAAELQDVWLNCRTLDAPGFRGACEALGNVSSPHKVRSRSCGMSWRRRHMHTRDSLRCPVSCDAIAAPECSRHTYEELPSLPLQSGQSSELSGVLTRRGRACILSRGMMKHTPEATCKN